MVVSRLFGWFSWDMGIDLGTENTRVCVRGKGIVHRGPTVVAVKKGTHQVLDKGAAVGVTAKEMVGRAPLSIDVVRPLKDGVIADFDVTEALIASLIRQVHNRRRWVSPRVLINTPTGITAVEKRAIFNAAERAGARQVYLVEQPRAAGVGAGLPIHEPRGQMVIDIGAGTTDFSVLALGDVVESKSIKVGGDAMNEAISSYLRRSFNILIGQNTAEQIKLTLGSAYPAVEEAAMEVRGRELLAGVPRAVAISSVEVREALREPIHEILEGARSTLERLGPELAGDLLSTGITLCGGGALLPGLAELIAEESGLPVCVAENPTDTVARGLEVFLEFFEDFVPILESAEDDL